MSRRELESLKLDNKNIVVISIADPDNPSVKIPEGVKGYLRLEFYDIEENINNYFPMNERDADQVSKFAKIHWGRADCIIVQCEAGISRSAGVAGAILKYFTGNDCAVFGSKRYYPNRLCYRLTLNALEEEKNE
jgi:predicted protein tyrosine phosphatase